MTAVSQVGSDGSIQAAIDSRITALPAGFTHRAVLTFAGGINAAFDLWGQTLTGLTGKNRPTNDSATLLNRLSYWTDAGSAYYYHPQDGSAIRSYAAPGSAAVQAILASRRLHGAG